MRWIPSILMLVGALALSGTECNQQLFPPIPCVDDADCEAECDEFCFAVGDEVESAVCDANDLCECLCMPPTGMGGPDGGGGMGTGGSGGAGE